MKSKRLMSLLHVKNRYHFIKVLIKLTVRKPSQIMIINKNVCDICLLATTFCKAFRYVRSYPSRHRYRHMKTLQTRFLTETKNIEKNLKEHMLYQQINIMCCFV